MVGVAVMAAASGLYLATLSHHFSADSVQFALAIDDNDWSRLLSPYHPLLGVVQWLAVRAARGAGYAGSTLTVLQVLNALAAGAAVGLFSAIVERLTGSRAMALATAAGFALSGASWLLATEAELAFLSLPLALIAIGRALSLVRGDDHLDSVRLGVLVGMASLAYATNLALAAILALAFWLSAPAARRNLRPLLSFLAVVLVIFFAGEVLGAAVRHIPISHYLYRSDLEELRVSNLYRGGYGMLRSFALFKGLGMDDRTLSFLHGAPPRALLAFATQYAAVVVVVLAPAAVALVSYISRARGGQTSPVGDRSEAQRVPGAFAPLAVIAVWAACAGGFATVWVPGDLSFWLPVVPAWWIASAIIASESNISNLASRAPIALAALAVILGAINYVAVIGPHRDESTNTLISLVHRMERETSEDDVLLSDHLGVQLYARYFARREVEPLSTAKKPAGRARVKKILDRGGRVLLVEDPGTQAPMNFPLALELLWKEGEFDVSALRP